MKITKDQLKQIIGEELEKVLALEAVPAPMPNSELDALVRDAKMDVDTTDDAVDMNRGLETEFSDVSVDDEVQALQNQTNIEMPPQEVLV